MPSTGAMLRVVRVALSSRNNSGATSYYCRGINTYAVVRAYTNSVLVYWALEHHVCVAFNSSQNTCGKNKIVRIIKDTQV